MKNIPSNQKESIKYLTNNENRLQEYYKNIKYFALKLIIKIGLIFIITNSLFFWLIKKEKWKKLVIDLIKSSIFFIYLIFIFKFLVKFDNMMNLLPSGKIKIISGILMSIILSYIGYMLMIYSFNNKISKIINKKNKIKRIILSSFFNGVIYFILIITVIASMFLLNGNIGFMMTLLIAILFMIYRTLSKIILFFYLTN